MAGFYPETGGQESPGGLYKQDCWHHISLVAQWAEDLVLSLLWLGFNPWPGNWAVGGAKKKMAGITPACLLLRTAFLISKVNSAGPRTSL